jgi:hypothetical protein
MEHHHKRRQTLIDHKRLNLYNAKTRMESMVKVDIVSWKDKRGEDIQKSGVDVLRN